MNVEPNNLSEEYKKGYEAGVKNFASRLLSYELDLPTDIKKFIEFIERTASK